MRLLQLGCLLLLTSPVHCMQDKYHGPASMEAATGTGTARLQLTMTSSKTQVQPARAAASTGVSAQHWSNLQPEVRCCGVRLYYDSSLHDLGPQWEGVVGISP